MTTSHSSSSDETLHPSSIALEAFACGENDASVAAHLESCGACKAFTAKIEEAQRAFSASMDVDAVLRAAEEEAATPEAKIIPLAPRGVAAADAHRGTGSSEIHARASASLEPRKGALALRVLPFIAVAAGVLLFLRLSRETQPSALTTPRDTAPVAANDPAAVATPNQASDTAFKGGIQLAVIRERDGAQKRFTSEVTIRPGDRLRIEVALDHSQNILAGVLADDGTFLDLLHEGPRGAGTFFSEDAAHFDASPTRGVVIVGTRSAVEAARAAHGVQATTDGSAGIASLRVTWEGPEAP